MIILQNDMGNKFSPTTISAAVTSKYKKNQLPTHLFISKNDSGLPKDSTILLEQIRTISKMRLIKKVGDISDNNDLMSRFNDVAKVSLGL